jgi:hypothetical protein
MRRALNDEDRGEIKSLAVFSGLGPKMSHSRIGTTIFGNNHEFIDVGAWRLDSFIEAVVLKELKANPNFTTIGLAPLAKPRLEAISEEKLGEVIQAAKTAGYDALLVILPSHYENAAKGMEPGYGIQKLSNLFTSRTSVYLLAILRVYRLSDEKSIAWQWAFDSMNGKPSYLSSEEFAWRENYNEYSAQEKTEVQRILKRHIEIAIPYSLRALHLVPKP